jgi:hypothetical protein
VPPDAVSSAAARDPPTTRAGGHDDGSYKNSLKLYIYIISVSVLAQVPCQHLLTYIDTLSTMKAGVLAVVLLLVGGVAGQTRKRKAGGDVPPTPPPEDMDDELFGDHEPAPAGSKKGSCSAKKRKNEKTVFFVPCCDPCSFGATECSGNIFCV